MRASLPPASRPYAGADEHAPFDTPAPLGLSARRLRVVGATLLALLLVAGAWFLPGRTAEPSMAGSAEGSARSMQGDAGTTPAVGPETLERLAIEAHLAEVEAALRARPTPHLGGEQREARVALLDALRAYREAGAFPRNTEVPGRSPVFVDDRGVHCAVGHLLHITGEEEIVHAIRTTRNLARLPDLLDEPGLPAWLEAHGLAPEEAAWIQPAYCNLRTAEVQELTFHCPDPVNDPPSELRDAYLLASGGTGALSVGLTTLNLLDLRARRASSGRAMAGMAAGAAGFGLGLAGIFEGGDARSLGWANAAVGALGMGTAALTFRRSSAEAAAAPGEGPRVVSVRPWFPPPAGEDTSGGSGQGAGIQFRVAW